MVSHSFIWSAMVRPGPPWTLLGPPGTLFGVPHGPLWSPIDPLWEYRTVLEGSLWNPLPFYNMFDQPWFCTVMFGQPWFCMDLSGPIWFPNDPLLPQNKEKEKWKYKRKKVKISSTKLDFALTYAPMHKFCACSQVLHILPIFDQIKDEILLCSLLVTLPQPTPAFNSSSKNSKLVVNDPDPNLNLTLTPIGKSKQTQIKVGVG